MKAPKPRRLALMAAVGALLLVIAGFVFRDELRGARARWRYPRIVVVTLDTLHVNWAGPYNPEIDYTPTLDRIAAAGVTFEHAYTLVPITLPTHASLFTGRQPPELGVMVNGDVLADQAETLAERLRRYGYRTGAVTSLGVLAALTKLDQGFDHYDDQVSAGTDRWYRTADEVVTAAAGWLEEAADDPFLLWLHLSDPHEPYLPKGAPPDVRLTLDGETVGEWTLTTKEMHRTALELPPGRHELTWQPLRQPRPDDYPQTALVLEQVRLDAPGLPAPPETPAGETWLRDPFTLSLDNPGPQPVRLELAFRGRTNLPAPSEVFENYPIEIGYMDRYLAEFENLLEERGLAEDTLWVVVSDHGEGLFHFGSIGHATYTQEDQLRLVWLLKGPGIPAGERVSGEAVLVDDVMPTVLDLLGLPAPRATSGRSQTGCWRAAGCARREEWWAYGASVGREEVTALAGYRWPYKLLWQNRRRTGLFDVSEDPFEEVDLARLHRDDPEALPEEFARLQARLERHRRALQRRLEERSVAELTSEQEEILRGLGYIN